MDTIKKVEQKDIDQYMEVYLYAYPAYKDMDQECYAKYKKRTLLQMENDKDVHFTALYRDGRIIATMKLIDFKLNAFGKIIPAVGLMALGVHPLFKKKGAALMMIKYFEEYCKNSGCGIGLLLPFNMKFYKNMGYGFGSKLDQYHIATASLPSAGDTSHLKFIDISSMDTVLDCYSRFQGSYHGMLNKFSGEIRDMKDDSNIKYVGYYDNSRLMGWISYHYVAAHPENYTINEIYVDGITYENGEVLKSLLSFLRLQADQVQSVVINTGEKDFYHIIDDPQDLGLNYIDYGFMETNISAIGTMYKLVAPEVFVKQTGHRQFPPFELTLRINYEDELSHIDKFIDIEFIRNTQDKYSSWKCTKGKVPDVEIGCKLGQLSSMFMGACEFSSLVRLGEISISDTKWETILDWIFHCNQLPWTNTDY